jgi:hypothetical protein
MTLPTTLRPAFPTGLAFELEDHAAIRDWALLRDCRPIVRLDHEADDEDYEEVVALCSGWRIQCNFIIWRNAEAVFVQPLIGRRQRYQSVAEALAASVLNKPFVKPNFRTCKENNEISQEYS